MSPFLEKYHDVEGPMADAKERFYELARGRVRHMTAEKIKLWHGSRNVRGEINAGCMIAANEISIGDGNVKKWVHMLDIVVNDNAFTIEGENFGDVMPLVVEHEIQEAWLHAKKGAGPQLSRDQKHKIARRHEYLLAAEVGLGERLLKYHTLRAANQGEHGVQLVQECSEALAYAKKRLERKQAKS